MWFGAAALLLIYIFLWLITGKVQVEDIFTWWVQNIGPFLTLITISFIVAYGQSTTRTEQNIDVFFFRLSVVISLFYFGLLLIILLMIPINQFHYGADSARKSFNQTSKIIPYFQTILGGVLGVFFSKKK